MRSATVFHRPLKTAVLPVKWTPARSRLASARLLISRGSPGTKLITPGGSPASSRTRKRYQLDSIAVAAGFHSTPLPISAGAVDRLPPIAVKLNGVMA